LINLQLGDVSHIIQLAIAPVFLLTGVGTNLTVLTNRLGRIIDRSRAIEDMLETEADNARRLRFDEKIIELEELYNRSHLINRAITLSTACALLVCLVIASLFLGDATGLGLDKLIAGLFVAGILSLIGSFIYFLREIFVATKTLTRQRLHGRKNISQQ
jgi:hypothetical protein